MSAPQTAAEVVEQTAEYMEYPGAAGPAASQPVLDDLAAALGTALDAAPTQGVLDSTAMGSSASEAWDTASEAASADSPSSNSADEDAPVSNGKAVPHTAQEMKGCSMYGCEHYRRRCKLVTPCCGEVVWCRHCHNTAKSDNEQDPHKRHVLDRKAVKELVCAVCDTRQPVGRACISCGCAFGQYACLACRFYDDDTSKNQFHCDKCGICRVGGKENFFHCDTCNCCYAVQLRNTHVCIENSMHHNCPVCFEYLFDSVKPINVLPCGHTIHQDCLQSMAEHHSYVCPVCSKSYLQQGNKERLWQELDAAVAATPMPEEYRNFLVNILCNDCNIKCQTRFHVIGHKCSDCGGYNTRRL